MTRLMIALSAVGIFVAGSFAVSSSAEEKKEEKITIKQVMAKCMKGNTALCPKVVGGSASDEEKAELLKMFKGLAAAKPKKGDAESWKAKTKALVDAAQAVVDDKDGAGDALKGAANCANCHKVHK